MQKNIRLILFIVGGVSVICICVFSVTLGIFLTKSSDNENEKKDEDANSTNFEEESDNDTSFDAYTCLFSRNDSLEEIGGFKAEIVVSDDEDVEWGEFRKDNGVRQFDYEQFKNDTSKDKIYFTISKKDGTTYKSITMYLQACKSDNGSSFSSYLESKSENPIFSDPGEGQNYSSTTELPFFAIDTKDNYRIDGLIFYEGQWKLVARVENLKFD